MAINTKVALINEIDKLIDSVESNQETHGLLGGLFALVQQVDRSFQRETKFKAKKRSGLASSSAKPMPPNAEFAKEDFEKKTVKTRAAAQPVKAEPNEEPAPVEVETKEQPNEGELLDIVTDGLDKIKEQYKSPKVFAKKLKSIGVDATGKTHEELFAQAKAKFDEISQ